MRDAPSVHVDRTEDARTIVLREPATGSEVHVVPDVGNNVTRFRTRVADREVDVIASPPSIGTLRDRPSRWGVAVLFPYPGRVSGGRFTFRGSEIVLPIDPRDGTAMHGVVRARPWRVVGEGADAGGAWVRTQIATDVDGIPDTEWPFPFSIEVQVSLRGGRLRLETQVVNIGRDAMPMGLGFHPYFPTPLGPLGSADECTVWVDASELWDRAGDSPPTVTPLGPTDSLRQPRPLGTLPTRTTEQGETRNLLFRRGTTGRSDDRGGVRAELRDPRNRLSITLEASAGFSALVLYTPPAPPVVSLEPLTCVPNAFNLATQGYDQTGMLVLEPAHRWRGWFEIGARTLNPEKTTVW